MKVLTILGTRPEIIRLSRVIERLDATCRRHVLVHTGQNYAESLSDVFFDELRVREPDAYLGIREASFGAQIGAIIGQAEQVLVAERPDRLLILGDTNSGLAAIPAKRLGIPVFHMEAGNRCYDDRVPEEVNRRIIDHSSDVLMPYTERSRANLVREGFASDRIYVIGNPIYEVLNYYSEEIGRSDALSRLGLNRGKYFLATLHREENVDLPERLGDFMTALGELAREYQLPVICSVHPRTRDRIGRSRLTSGELALHEPFGFFDFVSLEQNAYCVLSDSGTVQEECCIFGTPNVTLRDVTERPETLEAGSNILTGSDPSSILRAVRTVVTGAANWRIPPEYQVADVSSTVVKIVLGHLELPRRARAGTPDTPAPAL
jgi:UDP-N-acetylglucosamine 2-epimerase (non-hydrolysing)